MAAKYDTTNFDYLESVKIHNESLRIAEELMSKFQSFTATQSIDDDVFLAVEELVDEFLKTINWYIDTLREGNNMDNFKVSEKHKAEAEAQGAEVIGVGRDKNYRLYRLECGHEQEISTGNMRIGNFCCQTCEDTSRTLPSYVYLLKIRNGSNEWLKLGYAKNVDTRVSQYGLPKTATVEHITAVRFKTGNEAHAFETALHQKYKEHLLTKRKAKALGMEKNGFAECYPVEMLDELLKELTNLKNINWHRNNNVF
jgi:hypothetical protein